MRAFIKGMTIHFVCVFVKATYVEVVLAVAAVSLKGACTVDGLDEEVIGAKVIASHKLLCT